MLLTLCAAAFVRGAAAQPAASPLAVEIRSPCAPAEFFDASSLACTACDASAGFFPSSDGLGCALCDPQAGAEDGFAGGFALAATWSAAALSAGRCACAAPAPSRVVAAMAGGGGSDGSGTSSSGRRYARCVECPAGTAADAAGGTCAPAAAAPRTPAGDLAHVVAALNARGAGISLQAATQATLQAVHAPGDGGDARAVVVEASAPLARLLGPAARRCMDDGERRGCNAVANLCALQLYSP